MPHGLESRDSLGPWHHALSTGGNASVFLLLFCCFFFFWTSWPSGQVRATKATHPGIDPWVGLLGAGVDSPWVGLLGVGVLYCYPQYPPCDSHGNASIVITKCNCVFNQSNMAI